MLNTPEKRRQLLIVVTMLFLFHAFASEWIITREDVTDSELYPEIARFFDEYQLLWGNDS